MSTTPPPDLEQLSALLDQIEQAEPPPDRRSYPRTPARGTIPVRVQLADPPTAPPLTGTLRDLSRTGIGLNLPTPLPHHAHFHLHTTVGPRTLAATYRVANCRPDPVTPNSFIVGALLLQTTTKPTPLPTPTSSPSGGPIDEQHLADLKSRLDAALDDPSPAPSP